MPFNGDGICKPPITIDLCVNANIMRNDAGPQDKGQQGGDKMIGHGPDTGTSGRYQAPP
jgi:hypothetical protein